MYKDADKWRRYKRDYNALLKANHLCRDCKAQDGHTLNGFLLCWDCQQKANDRQRERRSKESYKAQRRIEVKAEYDARKSEGKCPQCSGMRDSSRYKLCAHCRALKRMGAEKKESVRRIIENVNWPRGANGYCWQCNRRKAIDGKKLCAECYQTQLVRLQHTWAVNAERRKNAERKSG
jgi:hypothetical protein